eukprot:14770184-Alexandrium_andersonii.AAC.1
MMVEIVGPILEPRLSPHQTAVAGGDCGSNLRAAFAHLRGADQPGAAGLPRDPPPLWMAVMGPAGQCLWRIATGQGGRFLLTGRAVLFAD